MESTPALYLIDGSTNIYRAYHALRNLANAKGFPTNAVYGFTSMLVKLLQECHPHYLGIVFDAKGPTFRHEMYNEYKATRPGMPDDLVIQLPYIKKIIEGFSIKSYEFEGYEADDIIGTLAKKAGAMGIPTVIVSVDKDFFQLIDAHITLLNPVTNIFVGVNEVQERFGVTPDKVIELFGLCGDASDNVPGVAGIGEKTATTLIQKYGSIKNVYEHLEEITQKSLREKLAQGFENACLSKDLVTINTQIPLSFDLDLFRITKPDPEILEPIFKELEFNRFLKEFIPRKAHHPTTYQLLRTQEEFQQALQELKRAPSLTLTLETTSPDPLRAKLLGFSFSCQPHQAFHIPLNLTGQTKEKQWVLTNLKPLLEDKRIKKLGHNLKYDYVVLLRNGIHLQGIEEDTMVASYLLNPSKRNHDLREVALEQLDYLFDEPESKGRGKVKSLPFERPEPEEAYLSFCEKADIIFLLANLLFPKLKEKSLDTLYYTIEMPLMQVLARMELTGVKVNPHLLSELSKALELDLEGLEKRIHVLAGTPFNINSPQQLSEVLFEKLKLPVITRTKTGRSTDVDVLTKLATIHELPALVLEYRRLSKLKSTYIDVLPKLINPETGRIHTTFNQTVTATGRLSSSDPNVQNIPIRGDLGKQIRQAFIGEKGFVLVSADYSQIELRIMAHLSGDANLREAFIHDEDIHTKTAAEVFQVSPDQVTEGMRREAKVINFGIMYGMGPNGLSQELGISREEARSYIDSYFAEYQGVKRYIDETLESARDLGYVVTLSGRIRYLPEINSSNRMAREFAERVAINTPIQGTAADCIKIAMIRIDQRIQKEKLNARMILQVHDELLFEVSKSELHDLMTLVKEEMEGAMKLDVPIKASIKYGKNWDEAH